ncbi:hypothetical protein B0H21DRAFT_688441 [Amylocystis lapponica]|nr:hypothetical protein B0H21DRAFT_688441 [Amylocystis lapponica]
MFNLSNLHGLLSQVLVLPTLHTAVLFTPQGQLVSYASDPHRPKDRVRVIVGLSGEVWQETRDQGIGMVDSELGRLLVLPIEHVHKDHEMNGEEQDDPLMLLALNAENSVSWHELENKASKTLVKHLERPVTELRGRLAAAPVLPVSPRGDRVAR